MNERAVAHERRLLRLWDQGYAAGASLENT